MPAPWRITEPLIFEKIHEFLQICQIFRILRLFGRNKTTPEMRYEGIKFIFDIQNKF